MLKIMTFGGLSIEVDGQAIRELGSHKAEAILVYLAVESRPQSRSILASLLWPESSPDHALTSLRVALSCLRKMLAEYLEIGRDKVGIKIGAPVFLDVSDFEQLLAARQVEQALQIYRGDFLAGFQLQDSLEFEDWFRWKAESFRKQAVNALHSAIDAAVETGDFKKGDALVGRLLAVDPLDELAHQQAILLLALAGQRSAALAHFEKCCQIFQAELGIEPSPETRDLHEQVLRAEKPTGLGLARSEHNLPAPQTSFIGREKELAQIQELLHDPACRMLTLVGPSGIGKTRLAVQAARQARRSFPDGTWFVPIEPVPHPDYLIPAIADAIRFKIDSYASEQGPKRQLLDYLRDRSFLLVLDGFEGLLSAAGLLSELLEQAPRLKLLVTTRQRLDLKAEWPLYVTGLPVPRVADPVSLEDSSALALFADRARQNRTDFQLSGADREQTIHICQLVDGMPLGIELAASWTSILTLPVIASEIENSLDFLATSMRDMPEKHRSLRAALDHSWQLLTEEQRRVFCMLSVFSGGFDRNAAQIITGANLVALSGLMEKSLLRRDKEGRFHMHGLLRKYAAERLAEDGTVHAESSGRHCRYYVDFLIEREADLMGSRMVSAREEVRQEMENVRAAVHWASLHWETGQILPVFQAYLNFYGVQSWHEGVDAFRNLAVARQEWLLGRKSIHPNTDLIYLSARIYQAFFLANLSQQEESELISSQCLQPLQALLARAELSVCYMNLGVNASFRGDYGASIADLEQAVLLGTETRHVMLPPYLLWLGHSYYLAGEYRHGMLKLQECYDLYQARGSQWGKGFALSKMGLAADGLEDYALAMRYHEEALSIFEEIQETIGKAYVLSRMSMGAYFKEEYEQAVHYGQQGYEIFQSLGHRWGVSASLCRTGFARIGQRQIEPARECFITALQQAIRDDSIPLRLYAILGLACVLARTGSAGLAGELYRYARAHIQTPALYIAVADRWIKAVEPVVLADGPGADIVHELIDPVDAVAQRLLNFLGNPPQG